MHYFTYMHNQEQYSIKYLINAKKIIKNYFLQGSCNVTSFSVIFYRKKVKT